MSKTIWKMRNFVQNEEPLIFSEMAPDKARSEQKS